jgi:hypothetical protein
MTTSETNAILYLRNNNILKFIVQWMTLPDIAEYAKKLLLHAPRPAGLYKITTNISCLCMGVWIWGEFMPSHSRYCPKFNEANQFDMSLALANFFPVPDLNKQSSNYHHQ